MAQCQFVPFTKSIPVNMVSRFWQWCKGRLKSYPPLLLSPARFLVQTPLSASHPSHHVRPSAGLTTISEYCFCLSPRELGGMFKALPSSQIQGS